MAPSPSSTPNSPRHSCHASSLPILPIEIVEEIICRLPVKFLLQLRCVCKSWNSLISDPKFSRRHLRRFNGRILLVSFMDSSSDSHFMSYPLSSILTAVTIGAMQLHNPLEYGDYCEYSIIGSCDGIICWCTRSVKLGRSFIAWNPSIRKIWKLTPFKKPVVEDCYMNMAFYSYGFGYDHLSNSFKLIVLMLHYKCLESGYKTNVMVHTLGSNSWREISDFPGLPFWDERGKLVSGAVNWLACDGDLNPNRSIISLNLGNETYQKLLQPDYGIKVDKLILDVISDCLCIVANYSDVWVMKEYGNNESWSKLFSFNGVTFPYYLGKHTLYVSEDDETLLHSRDNLGIYNHINGTLRSFDLENKPGLMIQDMYVEIESLISPCPQN